MRSDFTGKVASGNASLSKNGQLMHDTAEPHTPTSWAVATTIPLTQLGGPHLPFIKPLILLKHPFCSLPQNNQLPYSIFNGIWKQNLLRNII